jgi:hypothetical protein
MPRITEDREVLHELPVWFYPNHLKDVEGKFVARPVGERTLAVREICVKAMKDGYQGDVDEMVETVTWFLETAAFQLIDGFGVNMDYFAIRAYVGGTFENQHETILTDKHPIGFRFRALRKLRDLTKLVRLKVEGVAPDAAYIVEFVDNASGTIDEIATPRGACTMTGANIKIAGDPAETGIYFIAQRASPLTMKVTANLVENNPSKIIAMIPLLPAGQQWVVEIRTQFTKGPILLKEVRTIKGDFELST